MSSSKNSSSSGSRVIGWIDFETVAKTIYGEARGEIHLGKIAVAWVIRNRVLMDVGKDGRDDWWGEGYADVCLKPYQFSCWNPSDPQSRILKDVQFHELLDSGCITAAALVLGNRTPDPTNGCTHYLTESLFQHIQRIKREDHWAYAKAPRCRIGHHAFFEYEQTLRREV